MQDLPQDQLIRKLTSVACTSQS
uniref:Drosophila melanogaster ftz protein n=1 Tax=Drosophila melanogaster TaxID=7227 RepID=V9H100_DROME|nr:hypothetical protein (ftz 5' region) - fruit fly (Drosophila melanogaster) [Drosophila melanogaster]CAA25407.1 unnamed protein product [Drosophila melanogaster]